MSDENKCGGGCPGCGTGNEPEEGKSIEVSYGEDGGVKVEDAKEPTLYQKAGVDIEAADAFVNSIGHMVNPNHRNLNSFSGMLPMPKGYKNPVLAFSTDGVGTKGRVCLQTNKFKHIGIDLAAVVINDLICSGAQPVAFLDYMASGKLIPKVAHMIVQGIQVGCDYVDMTIMGGETAELPGQYKEEYYHDFAGFGMGVVERDELIDGSLVEEGDVLIGLLSNGVHANGFALIQHLIDEKKIPWFPTKEEMKVWDAELSKLKMDESEDGKKAFDERLAEIQGAMKEVETFSDELLRPVKLYYKAVMAVKKAVKIHGAAHISGGGLVDNVPRMLSNNERKDGLSFDINVTNWTPPEIFQVIKKAGEIPDEEMWKVFNNGIGFVLCVSYDDQDAVMEALEDVYEDGAVFIGTVITREEAEGKEIIIE